MNLLSVVYFVNLLVSADNFLNGLIGALIIIALIAVVVVLAHLGDFSEEETVVFKQKAYKYALWPKTILFSIFMCWVIPNEKTMQYMAGAYIIEQTYNSDFVQQASTLAGKAVLNQLANWAEDNSDVETLLNQLKQQGVNVPNVDKIIEKSEK
jgi:hypothetical protein